MSTTNGTAGPPFTWTGTIGCFVAKVKGIAIGASGGTANAARLAAASRQTTTPRRPSRRRESGHGLAIMPDSRGKRDTARVPGNPVRAGRKVR